MIGKLLTQCGASRVTREELRAINPPEGTRTWRPVKHSDLIDAIDQEITQRSLRIRQESYAVQRDGTLLFGVIDLAWRETNEFAAAIGLRTSNNRSYSINVCIGMRVLVCDNLAFSGDVIALRRKHTSGLDLQYEIARAMDRYQEGVVRLEQDINKLKETTMSDQYAKLVIFEVFHQGIMPIRFFKKVADPYFLRPGAGPRTMWTLHNVCTREVKEMVPAQAFPATVRLGKLFGLGHTNGSLGSQH